MINNLVFTVSTIVVLWAHCSRYHGRLFPRQIFRWPPYFNAVFVPLMALVMPFMAVGPLSRWRRTPPPLVA